MASQWFATYEQLVDRIRFEPRRIVGIGVDAGHALSHVGSLYNARVQFVEATHWCAARYPSRNGVPAPTNPLQFQPLFFGDISIL